MEFLNRIAALLLMLSAATVAFAQGASAQTDAAVPHLETRGRARQLIVDGKPFLILAGELHNSSSSSVAYMKPLWPKLAARHLNTVLVPIAWETIEPAEGAFDFTVLDGLLQGARDNHLRLVVLWFGAWKNTYSTYVPGWVKKDVSRFPRVQLSSGQPTERLSPFSSAVRDADSRAFAQLMRHLRQTDGQRHTVLMVQVENEVGVIPEARDHAPIAQLAFSSPVPQALVEYLSKHRESLDPQLHAAWEASGMKMAGNWQSLFGAAPLTDDLFMAWQYATYVERVAAAGKAEYPLPLFANAALIRPSYQPGQYNSGGPLPQSIDVWHAGAPSLDILAPDVYFNEFAAWAQRYARADNPLFIPETQPGPAAAANALYAFGELDAIGFSPFGIDEEGSRPLDMAGIAGVSDRPEAASIGDAYAVLSHLADTVLDGQRSGKLSAALIEGEAQRAARLRVGDYIFTLTRPGNPDGGGGRLGVMVIQTLADEFLILASGAGQIAFSSDTSGPELVGIESIDEQTVVNGNWVAGRRLNGDESSQGQALRLNAADLAQGLIYKVRLYRYR